MPSTAFRWHFGLSAMSMRDHHSRQSQGFDRGSQWISVEDRVDALGDIEGGVQILAATLDRDQRSTGAVVHDRLQRLGQGVNRRDMPLNRYLADDDQAGKHWSASEQRRKGDKERHTSLGTFEVRAED